MKRHWIGLATALALGGCTSLASTSEPDRQAAHAAAVTITRDNWGIAHVKGETDADAVFGMIYAQAEDDFNRIETNYLNAMGRLAEAEGQSVLFQDLRMKLFIDPTDLQTKYAESPGWLRELMTAWADGLNYYLAKHPETKPRVITHFEPWMALSFTEGSIGGDIEKVSLSELKAFYDGNGPDLPQEDARLFKEPTGSNGIAIGPSRSADGHALLLINPHTSFYFRSELQASSGQGLNAYGAATWGQFFIYQGFNENAGWMHTSSGVDVVDEFAETIIRRGGKLFYRYGSEERPVKTRTINVPYRLADGSMSKKTFTAYATHHGPIVRAANGKWVAIALMQKPIEALSQSYLRTKAKDYAGFIKVAETYKANSSNNTLFADSKGATAYLHPQFVPKRNDRFDYTRPVDGSDPLTDWKGLHEMSERPNVISPKSGWIYNSNNWPYTASGPDSPKRDAFPRYMDSAGQNPRGLHAEMLLKDASGVTIEKLRNMAYDSYLPAFADLIPALVKAWDETPASDPLKAQTADQIASLRTWDYRWSAASTQTSLAVFWGETLWLDAQPRARAAGANVYEWMREKTSPQEKLAALAAASNRLQADFGNWKTPWGEINRFQRLDDSIAPHFDDAKPSISVPFTSAQWGSLASFGARRYDNTKKYYGSSGNSFVSIVEFGPKLRAIAVTAGGESGDPSSPHFLDQAERYAAGNLREVYFNPDQLAGHALPPKHPGD